MPDSDLSKSPKYSLLSRFSSTLAAFRAQGELTAEKRRLLSEMAQLLNVEAGRHRAEVRKIVNDERLTNICKQLTGIV